MDMLKQIKRVIELAIMPIKALPFQTNYSKGQIDMADTIFRLVDIMDTGIEKNIDVMDEDGAPNPFEVAK